MLRTRVFHLFDFIISILSPCKRGKYWLFQEMREWNFRAQTPWLSEREGEKCRYYWGVCQQSPSNSLQRSIFQQYMRECSMLHVLPRRSTSAKRLQESNASVLNWTLGFPFLSIKAICWSGGELCRAVVCPSKPAHMWCSLSKACPGKTCTR